jgi:hypothetical protein
MDGDTESQPIPEVANHEGERLPEPPGGPRDRARAFLAERTARLRPREARAEAAELAPAGEPPASSGQPAGPSVAVLPPNFRQNLVQEYRRRQQAQLAEAATEEEAGGRPTGSWISIGPSVVRQGQGDVKPATSGRVLGIAVAPGGAKIYVATANGGVWRSTDTGRTWVSLMDAFDLNPTAIASDTLACGAIALVPGSPDHIYVGSGDGDGGLGSYFGVGPVVSRDGGTNWRTEAVASGSPPLAGKSFHALAVDPANTERVVAATIEGIYRREPASGGLHQWRETHAGRTTSLVVARQGTTTTFYAAPWGGPVISSTEGASWSPVGTGFPTVNVGRVGAATQSGNPNVLYALVARSDNNLLLGLWRLDRAEGNWRPVSGVPTEIFGTDPPGQGWYDVAIVVDPNNVNRIYLGGSTKKEAAGSEWSGALWRGEITVAPAGVTIVTHYLGGSVHADIHALVFAPGDSNKLWVGCDGGVFYSTNPTGTGYVFESRNVGLSTLTLNNLGQHPTEDAVLFSGSQDNGGLRYTGEEAWLYSSNGDSGFAVVNWHDPLKVLTTWTSQYVYRSTNGGQRGAYGELRVPIVAGEPVQFYAPIAGTPPSGTPSDADIVAFGSIRPWISTTFGGSWSSIPTGTLPGDRLDDEITSLSFASASKLYAGTIGGGIYRFDHIGPAWTRLRLDTIGTGANALAVGGAPITDIAIDPADASGNSIYIAFAGQGDYRHVWHFDGSRWQQRSGPSPGHARSLMDVVANAIAVDPSHPSNVYLGADIGVWASTDSGRTWTPMSEGLPDAAVRDLALNDRRRVLRAATYGRGVYERDLDGARARAVELYSRDTQLDRGRSPTVDSLPDPTAPGRKVVHYRGPDIRVDLADTGGSYLLPRGPIDFLQFTDHADDGASAILQRPLSADVRAHVQVHTRGTRPANGVRVILLVAHPSAGMPPLPRQFEVNVRSASPISTPDWRTIGFVTLNDVRAGAPKIASFAVPLSLLAPPGSAGSVQLSVLALLHHQDDPYPLGGTETMPDRLALTERKAVLKSLTVAQFPVGVATPGQRVIPVRIHSSAGSGSFQTSLLLNLRGYPGRVRLFVPAMHFVGDLRAAVDGASVGADLDEFRSWAAAHVREIGAPRVTWDSAWTAQRATDIERALATGTMLERSSGQNVRIQGIRMDGGTHHTIFVMLDRPSAGSAGSAYDLEVLQTDDDHRTLLGGMGVRVDLVPATAPTESVSLVLPTEDMEFLERLAVDVNADTRGVVGALVSAARDDPWMQERARQRLEAGIT